MDKFPLTPLSCCCPVQCCNSALLLEPALCQHPFLPLGPLCGVRAVKNQPLPQTGPAKSIHIPYSDQFVKAPLCSIGPLCVSLCVCVPLHVCVSVLGLHPSISPCSLVTQTVQHLIQLRQLSPFLAYISFGGDLTTWKHCWSQLISIRNKLSVQFSICCLAHWIKLLSLFINLQYFNFSVCFWTQNLWLKKKRENLKLFSASSEVQIPGKLVKVTETCLLELFFSF